LHRRLLIIFRHATRRQKEQRTESTGTRCFKNKNRASPWDRDGDVHKEFEMCSLSEIRGDPCQYIIGT